MSQFSNHQKNLKTMIAQMLIMGFEGHTPDDTHAIVDLIRHKQLGGIIAFDKNLLCPSTVKNIVSPSQISSLNQFLQSANPTPTHPLLICVDYEGGRVTRLPKHLGFPDTLSAQALALQPKAQRIMHWKKMANTLHEAGFNVNFAPVVDLASNPNNPIVACLERAFSDNAEQVTTFAQEYTDVMDQMGIASCYKHFPGHGSSDKDSHLGFVDITNGWRDDELLPYQQLALKNTTCQMIMVGHLIHQNLDPNHLPASLSYTCLTTLLREKIGFEGIIVSDDLQMQALSDHYDMATTLIKAVAAGNDMLIIGNQLSKKPWPFDEIVHTIEQAVIEKKLSEQRIAQSYERITQLKQHLYDHTMD